jgi:hypothetical protein
MHDMARAQAKTGDITIRMDSGTRAKIDRLAERRGLTTGALLRMLGLEMVDREETAARLVKKLYEMEPDEEGADELEQRRRKGRRR